MEQARRQVIILERRGGGAEAGARRGRIRRRPRWTRGHNGGRVDCLEDTLAGEITRRVLDSYCPYCASDIRSLGPRRLIRCPNAAICGKILPIDENCCPSCSHYIRPTDNFCRICRANLRTVVRGRGGLYQQLRRAPSPINNYSPPRQAENVQQDDDSDIEILHDDHENFDVPADNRVNENNDNENPLVEDEEEVGLLDVVEGQDDELEGDDPFNDENWN